MNRSKPQRKVSKRYRYSDGNTHTSNLSLAAAKKFQRLQNGGTVTLMTPASHWSMQAARGVIREFNETQPAKLKIHFNEQKIAEAFRNIRGEVSNVNLVELRDLNGKRYVVFRYEIKVN